MKKTVLMTAAVAGILSATCGQAGPDPKLAEGKCYGINGCKGQGECATKDHGCGGMNSCKGKGWLKLTKAACDEKKGTFEAVVDGKFM